jgi:hypothetical protein
MSPQGLDEGSCTLTVIDYEWRGWVHPLTHRNEHLGTWRRSRPWQEQLWCKTPHQLFASNVTIYTVALPSYSQRNFYFRTFRSYSYIAAVLYKIWVWIIDRFTLISDTLSTRTKTCPIVILSTTNLNLFAWDQSWASASVRIALELQSIVNRAISICLLNTIICPLSSWIARQF